MNKIHRYAKRCSIKHALKAQNNSAQWQRLGLEMYTIQNRALKGQLKFNNL